MRMRCVTRVLVVLFAIALTPGIAAAQARVRKDITTLSAAELGNYIHALNVVRARSAKNPADTKGYGWWAALHNDGSVGPCEHGNDQFLAWHRAHLAYFEDLLRAADPPRTANVTIPYWDFSRTGGPKFPAQFSVPGLDDSRSTAAASPPDDTLRIVTGTPDWNEFGGYPKGSKAGNFGDLEFGPHNFMHGRYIGGKMGDPTTAAEDPIYWSFHAFLDLLWDEWQRRNSNPAPTSPTANLRGFASFPKRQVIDFQSVGVLGYSYELTPALRTAFGIGGQESSRVTPQPKSDVRTLSRVQTVTKPPAGAQLFQYTLPAEATSGGTVTLRFGAINIPRRDNLILRAYVHPRSVPAAPGADAFERQYYVGYKAFWKSPVTGAESHHPATVDIRIAVDRARLAGSDLVATLVIARAVPPAGAAEAAAVPEQLTIGTAAAEIRR